MWNLCVYSFNVSLYMFLQISLQTNRIECYSSLIGFLRMITAARMDSAKYCSSQLIEYQSFVYIWILNSPLSSGRANLVIQWRQTLTKSGSSLCRSLHHVAVAKWQNMCALKSHHGSLLLCSLPETLSKPPHRTKGLKCHSAQIKASDSGVQQHWRLGEFSKNIP